MALISQRNSKMFVKLGGAGYASSPNPTSPLVGVSDSSPDRNTWEVPILAGFSFGQTTNSTEVSVNEAGFSSRRARVMYNDSLAPVEFSFNTYIRPTVGTGPTKVVAPEQVLWAMLMGADSFNATSGTFYSSMQMNAGSPSTSPAVSPGSSPNLFQSINTGSTNATSDTFGFSASNTSYFPQGNTVFFQVGDASSFELFSISNAQISSVTIDFDIEGIATAQWSGMGTSISRSAGTVNTLAGAFNQGTTQTTNFIRNKLSTITLSSFRDPASQSPTSPAYVTGEDTYSIVLTGGSFTIENNLNFLVPEELGKVNRTVGNITGTRTISGSLTCYYDTAVSSDKSAEFWSDLITGSSGSPTVAGTAPTIRNAHNLAINVGGTTGNRLILNIPTAHFEIPTINPDELFTLEANFHAIPPSGSFDRTDEAAITYAI